MIGDLVTLASSSPNAGDDFWYAPIHSGGISSSGVTVTEESMLSSTAVLQAVRLNAEMVATLPLNLLENFINEDDQPEVRHAVKHPLYNVLRFKPNPHLTAFQFWRMAAASEIIRGDFFAQILRAPNGKAELWPLEHSRVKIIRIDARTIEYEYTPPKGDPIPIAEADMFHISGFNTGGLVGRGLIKDGVDAIGRLKATETYGASVYKNGAAPGGALRHPGKSLSEAARNNLRDSWNALHQGVHKAHTVAILEEGVEWVSTGIHPKDAQLIEAMQFQILEVARATNTPPHLLMDMSKMGVTNTAELARQWLIFGLGARLKNIEQCVLTKFFGEADWHTYEPRFDTEQIQRPDMETFYKSMQIACGRPFVSVNEARAKVGLGAVAGEDVILAPLNMGNAGGDPELTPQPVVAPKQENQDIE